MNDTIILMRTPLACQKCRESLRQSLDNQKPERADSTLAISNAAYCDVCAGLALGVGPEGITAAKAADVCPRCHKTFSAPREAMAPMPAIFLKAICWAYLCDACAAIVIEAAAPKAVCPP